MGQDHPSGPRPKKPVKTRKCVFCSKKTGHRLQDTALLRTSISERGKIRARRVTGNFVSAPAGHRRGREERARSLCCRSRRAPARDLEMKLILHRRGGPPRLAGDTPSRSGRLRPQLPASARVGHRGLPWRSVRPTTSAARRSLSVRFPETANEIKTASAAWPNLVAGEDA